MNLSDRSGFDALLARSLADPDVIGLILTGSHARGLAAPWSDYDVRMIVRDEASAGSWAHDPLTTFPNVDLSVMSFREFVAHADWDTPSTWDRYSFAHAQVLLDRTGAIRPLVAEKGRLPTQQKSAVERDALDAFINGVYRSLKCRRRGSDLCARLEATEAVRFGLDFAFAREGRIRPYPVWLEHDLRSLPLRLFPLSGDALIALVSKIVEHGDAVALRQLLSVILDQARLGGHIEVIDSWGSDIDWMLHFSPDVI